MVRTEQVSSASRLGAADGGAVGGGAGRAESVIVCLLDPTPDPDLDLHSGRTRPTRRSGTRTSLGVVDPGMYGMGGWDG